MRQATPTERAEFGRQARAKVPRSSHGAWAPAAGPDRPARDPGPPGHHPASRPGSHPVRADGRLGLRLLPGGGGGDGRRPGHRRAHRPRGAAVRRRPPVQLRGIRLPRARVHLRRQRLRRDAPRPVRVGPQAPGGQPRDRRTPSCVRRGDPPVAGGRERLLLSPGHARVRRDAGPGHLVHPPRRHDDGPALGRPGQPQADRDLPTAHGQGPVQGPPGRAGQADPRGRRPVCASSTTPR